MILKNPITRQAAAGRIVTDVPIHLPVTAGNIRGGFVEEEQASLAQSIAQNGILVPLLGHHEGEPLVVDDGHRRLDAAKRAGLATVPMLIADHAPSPAERITLQLLANTMRVGLKVTEHARSLHDLMQASGWSAAEVSVRLGGPSPSHLSKLLSLLILPRDVQDLIDAGRIPMSSAYEIVKVADAAERERLVHEVVNGKLTRDRLAARSREQRTAKGITGPRKPRQSKRERVVIALGQGRSVVVSAPALSVESVITWLSDLATRLRAVGANGRSLPEAVKAITDNAA